MNWWWIDSWMAVSFPLFYLLTCISEKFQKISCILLLWKSYNPNGKSWNICIEIEKVQKRATKLVHAKVLHIQKDLGISTLKYRRYRGDIIEILHGIYRSWDNIDWSFEWGFRTPSLREEEAGRRGSGTVPFERAFIGPPYSNFSSIITRFGDICCFCVPACRWAVIVDSVGIKNWRITMQIDTD